jgi:diguanylate cyclase (GGDEF)-like protein
VIVRPIAGLRRALSAAWFALVVAAGAALVALGAFRRPTTHLVSLVAALGMGALLVARLAATLGRGSRRRLPGLSGGEDARARRAELKSDLELGALLLVAAYASFQATGGPRSILHPLVYALCAFLVTFHRRAVGLPLVALAIALEVALFLARHVGLPPADRALFGAHVTFLLFFAALHLVLLQSEVARQRREHARRLADEIARMRTEAHDFRLISSQLSAESRTRSREQEEEIIALGAVENIHQALFYTLELLKKSLDLHTVVLFWIDEEGGLLKIKELVTDSDHVSEEPLPLDAGVMGAVARDRVPIVVRDPKPEHLPFYEAPQPIGAFLAVPVVDPLGPAPAAVDGSISNRHPRYGEDELGGGHLRGVLCADRISAKGVPALPFDKRDEVVLVGAARQILRAIQSERVFTAVERSKYEHERFYRASDLLNRALTPDQVYATAFQSAREIAPWDFAAIALFDRPTRKHRVAAAMGEGAEEVAELGFSDNAGLAAMVVKNKHYLPAAGERRDKEMPVFTKKVKLRGMESLLVLPLIAADEAIGSFTLAAKAPHRFGKDKREMLGVIANQVAVSLKNAEMYRAMEEMATTDGLTNLVNHRTFQVRFADLLHRAERQKQPVSLLLTDIDHFKKVNDTHGHPVGDLVLKGVAAVCRAEVRKIDFVARYGGEEFAIVLDGTDRDGARQLAERIRREVAAQSFESDKGRFQCTLSLGVATYPDDGRDPKTLIGRADQALYQAKHGGRNRAVAWQDIAASSVSGPIRAVR